MTSFPSVFSGARASVRVKRKKNTAAVAENLAMVTNMFFLLWENFDITGWRSSSSDKFYCEWTRGRWSKEMASGQRD